MYKYTVMHLGTVGPPPKASQSLWDAYIPTGLKGLKRVPSVQGVRANFLRACVPAATQEPS